MIKNIGVALSTLAFLALAASPAFAGGKWQTNLAPESDTDPTLSPKSKVSFKDSGLLQVKVLGLTDGGGVLVTSDESFKGKFPTLNGDEYILILSGRFPALDVPFEFNLPFEVKAGNGKGKGDFKNLFDFIPPGLHRASELTSVKVVGPVGLLTFPDCQDNITAGGGQGGFVVLGALNPCDQGDLIAVGGVLIP